MKSEKAKSLRKGVDGYSCSGHQSKEGKRHVWKEKLAGHRSSCPITMHISLVARNIQFLLGQCWVNTVKFPSSNAPFKIKYQE